MSPRFKRPTEFILRNQNKAEFLNEGVGCQACHAAYLDNKKILKESILCAKCHQFQFRNSNEFAQQTYNEWLNYKNQGGTKTCQNCHMPAGSHEFRGVYSQSKKSPTSLVIQLVEKEPSDWRIELSNLKAGHNVPTGDVYRHLMIAVKSGDSVQFSSLEVIGRNPFWQTKENKKSVLIFKNNNAILPNEIRSIKLPSNVKEIEVTYYYEADWAGRFYSKENIEKKVIFKKKYDPKKKCFIDVDEKGV